MHRVLQQRVAYNAFVRRLAHVNSAHAYQLNPFCARHSGTLAASVAAEGSGARVSNSATTSSPSPSTTTDSFSVSSLRVRAVKDKLDSLPPNTSDATYHELLTELHAILDSYSFTAHSNPFIESSHPSGARILSLGLPRTRLVPPSNSPPAERFFVLASRIFKALKSIGREEKTKRQLLSRPTMRSFILLCARLQQWPSILEAYQLSLFIHEDENAVFGVRDSSSSFQSGFDTELFTALWKALAYVERDKIPVELSDDLRPEHVRRRDEMPTSTRGLAMALARTSKRLSQHYMCPTESLEYMMHALAFTFPLPREESRAMIQWWKREFNPSDNQNLACLRAWQLILMAHAQAEEYSSLASLVVAYSELINTLPSGEVAPLLSSSLINSCILSVILYEPSALPQVMEHFVRSQPFSIDTLSPPPTIATTSSSTESSSMTVTNFSGATSFGVTPQSLQVYYAYFQAQANRADAGLLPSDLDPLMKVLDSTPWSSEAFNIRLSLATELLTTHHHPTLNEQLTQCIQLLYQLWSIHEEIRVGIESGSKTGLSQKYPFTLSPDAVFYAKVIRLFDKCHREGVPFHALREIQPPIDVSSPPTVVMWPSFQPFLEFLFPQHNNSSSGSSNHPCASFLEAADRLNQAVQEIASVSASTQPPTTGATSAPNAAPAPANATSNEWLALSSPQPIVFNQATGRVFIPVVNHERVSWLHTATEEYFDAVCFLMCRVMRRNREARRDHQSAAAASPSPSLLLETDEPLPKRHMRTDGIYSHFVSSFVPIWRPLIARRQEQELALLNKTAGGVAAPSQPGSDAAAAHQPSKPDKKWMYEEVTSLWRMTPLELLSTSMDNVIREMQFQQSSKGSFARGSIEQEMAQQTSHVPSSSSSNSNSEQQSQAAASRREPVQQVWTLS